MHRASVAAHLQSWRVLPDLSCNGSRVRYAVSMLPFYRFHQEVGPVPPFVLRDRPLAGRCVKWHSMPYAADHLVCQSVRVASNVALLILPDIARLRSAVDVERHLFLPV